MTAYLSGNSTESSCSVTVLNMEGLAPLLTTDVYSKRVGVHINTDSRMKRVKSSFLMQRGNQPEHHCADFAVSLSKPHLYVLPYVQCLRRKVEEEDKCKGLPTATNGSLVLPRNAGMHWKKTFPGLNLGGVGGGWEKHCQAERQ